MSKRYVSIWFRHLLTDWFTLSRSELKAIPFVLRENSHGRMIVNAVNPVAMAAGIDPGMSLADARAINPGLEVEDEVPDLTMKLLKRLAEWCIRFTPCVSVDLPDGLLLDVTGCAHLWGGDEKYLEEIRKKISERGYHVRVSIADSIGAAWAVSRYGAQTLNITAGKSMEALLPLPAAALRIEHDTIDKLNKLGLRRIQAFINMPKSMLRRRFGEMLIERINQALGLKEEFLQPVIPVEPWQERLPCLELIFTATAIEIALKNLLGNLCDRLAQEGKGLRMAVFRAYRIDGKVIQIEIGTSRPSTNADHLFKLFEIRIAELEPEPGIELFVLIAGKVEDHRAVQLTIAAQGGGLYDHRVGELLDRIIGKIGAHAIHRYVPDEHHWPERSIKTAKDLEELPSIEWRTDRPRPMQLLDKAFPIEVTAPIPDYPPMLFRFKGEVYTIKKADGPERIEREWWLDEGEHRDYYILEDDKGRRYWVYRSGHYSEEKKWQWFLSGFFA